MNAKGTFKESCFVCMYIWLFLFVFEKQLKTIATQILFFVYFCIFSLISWVILMQIALSEHFKVALKCLNMHNHFP